MRVSAIAWGLLAAAIIAGAVVVAQKCGAAGDPVHILSAMAQRDIAAPGRALIAMAIIAPITLVLAFGRLAGRGRARPAQLLRIFATVTPILGVAAAWGDLAGALEAGARPSAALAQAALIVGAGLLIGAIAALPRNATWNGAHR
jgi:hypothetical protein